MIPPLPPPVHSSFTLPTSLLLISVISSSCHFAPIIRTLFIFKLDFFLNTKYFFKTFFRLYAVSEILVKLPIHSCCQKNLTKPTKTKHMQKNLPLPLYALRLVFSTSLSCNLLRKSHFPSQHCTALKTRLTVEL